MHSNTLFKIRQDFLRSLTRDTLGYTIYYNSYKNIILVEKINELSSDKLSFTINVGIPICKEIFSPSVYFNASVNGASYYNCLFTDISSPYNSIDKTITCTSQSTLNTINSINSFDDDTIFYTKGVTGSYCLDYNKICEDIKYNINKNL